MGAEKKKRYEKKMGPTFGGGMEGLQEWRVRVKILRGMENGGPYKSPVGVGFFPKISKFWSRGQRPHWSYHYR
jgi:hypothetical protein